MDARRLLIGIALFVVSLVLVWIGVMTPILGPLPEHPDLRAVYAGFTEAQKMFVMGCFFANAYGVGMVLNALVKRVMKK